MELLLDFLPMPKIVGIDRRHKLALRHGQALIARRRYAPIGLGVIPETGVGTRERIDDRRSAIAGSIIDHDDIEVPIGLVGYTGQSLADEFFSIKRGNLFPQNNFRKR